MVNAAGRRAGSSLRGRDASFVAMAVSFAFVCLLYPLLSNAIPPLLDYAGNVSRVAVLHGLLHGSAFGDMYRLDPAIVPNLAVDAMALPLMELGLSAETAGRCFLVLAFILLAVGVLALHYANFRRVSLWPALALPFLIQEGSLLGFINYLFGMGLGFCVVAAWRCDLTQRLAVSAPALSLGLVVLFFCHFAAFLLTAGMIIGLETGGLLNSLVAPERGSLAQKSLGVRQRFKRLAVCIASSLPPFALLMFAPMVADNPRPPATAFLGQLRFVALKFRLEDLLGFAFAYDRALDTLCLFLLIGLFVYGVATRSFRLDRAMLIPIGGLFLIYLVIPDGWYGTAALVDRLPMVLFMMAVAGSDLRLNANWQRMGLAGLVIGLAAARGASVERAWQAANERLKPLLAALESVPEGSRIYSAFGFRGDFISSPGVIYYGMPCYMVIHRHGYYPHVFATRGQNIVVPQPTYEAAPRMPHNYRADKPRPLGDDDPYSAARLAFYDYALIIGPGDWPVGPPKGLIPVAANREYVLLRIDKSRYPDGVEPVTPHSQVSGRP
jgi:hypothetical protein